jgi:hypothetical protein
MIRDHFRVLTVDLSTGEAGRGSVVSVEGRDTVAGGSGLAAIVGLSYPLNGPMSVRGCERVWPVRFPAQRN